MSAPDRKKRTCLRTGSNKSAPRSVQAQPSGSHLRQYKWAVYQHSSKCLALLNTACNLLQGRLANTNGSHAVVQPAGPKTPLRNFESSAHPQQHVACWNPEHTRFSPNAWQCQ
jgi:hypothetical protein